MRSIINDYIAPALLGLMLAGAVIYMVTHPSSCRWEEHC